MVVPFLIIYLFNWIVFIIILVCLLQKNYQSKSKKDTKTSFLHQQLIIAITLSVLFGLGWVIGLFATQDIHTNKTTRDILAALFVVFTAFHGLFIFMMQCLRSKDIRNSWKRCFFGVTRKEVNEVMSSTILHQKKYQRSSKTKFVADAKNPSSRESNIVFRKISDPIHSLRSLESVTKSKEEESVGFAETQFNKYYIDEIDDHEEKMLRKKKSDIIFNKYFDGFTYGETSLYFDY